MTDEEIKKAIIDALAKNNAFEDLPPSRVAQMAIDMVFAILKKAQGK